MPRSRHSARAPEREGPVGLRGVVDVDAQLVCAVPARCVTVARAGVDHRVVCARARVVAARGQVLAVHLQTARVSASERARAGQHVRHARAPGCARPRGVRPRRQCATSRRPLELRRAWAPPSRPLVRDASPSGSRTSPVPHRTCPDPAPPLHAHIGSARGAL